MSLTKSLFKRLKNRFRMEGTEENEKKFIFSYGIGEAVVETNENEIVIPCVLYTSEVTLNVLSLDQLLAQGFVITYGHNKCGISYMFGEENMVYDGDRDRGKGKECEIDTREIVAKHKKFLEEYFESIDPKDACPLIKGLEELEWDDYIWMMITLVVLSKRFEDMLKWFYLIYLGRDGLETLPTIIGGVKIDLMGLYKMVDSMGGYLDLVKCYYKTTLRARYKEGLVRYGETEKVERNPQEGVRSSGLQVVKDNTRERFKNIKGRETHFGVTLESDNKTDGNQVTDQRDEGNTSENDEFVVAIHRFPNMNVWAANLIQEHDENDHGLIEKIISLCDPNCDVGMLWQFKSHHSHLKSELIDDYFAENCNFSMEEGGRSEEPERMFLILPLSYDIFYRNYFVSQVTKSLKSRCRAAHFYYDQGERMLLMGKMTKALDHAREGCERRYHLLKENFELTLRDAKVYTFHMNHIVATRVWSISFVEFILAPNNSSICYLNSVHQEATILELIGDKLMAMSALEWGKGLNLQRGPSCYLERFHAAISRIYRKAQDINDAKKELRQAEELRRCVSYKSCQLLLKLEISKESAKQKRKFGTTWDITSAMQEFFSIEVLLKMQLNAKPSRKGHKNSKYGCKDYVFKDETSNARDVFLENICLVVSLSSLPSSESPMTLSMLFELVKRTEIKVVHATHIAELIYIISWVACTKGKSDGDFSIPSETLIATLKHALILSSETPELLKKIIWFLLGYLRLTTSSDVDLNDFVSKFYTQLQPHTILVINILGDKYKKLLWKLPFYVPCEHVAFLMISRFSSTRIPLFYLFQVNSKGSGRPGELWKAPWGTDTIVDTILPDFKCIVKDFEDGISAGTLDGRISNIIWQIYQNRCKQLKSAVISITNYKKKTSHHLGARQGYLDVALGKHEGIGKPIYIQNAFSFEYILHLSEVLQKSEEGCSQHMPIDALAKLDKCASAILMGCYSGLLELEGPYILKGAPIDYVLAGSPIVVGNLWVVRQTWALEFTKKLLKTFEGELEDEAGIVACLDLARKTYNNLMYRAGTICYGVPTLLRKRIP
ncbi:ARID DNA-binding domain-containing protein [Tanacetum coccineum]|uniref:ARID DNA-binding domain-containing protein n=1 Tax=Tanacetum coccineum TaxID=301880 RepID=A0ABQ5HN91_9ASTR